MTTVNTDQFAKTQTNRVTKFKPSEFGGEVRTAYAKYDSDNGTLADGDDIRLFRLPKGARVLTVGAVFGDFGQDVVLDVGTSSTADLFAADVDVSSAGTYRAAAEDVGELDDDTLVLAKLSGADPADDQNLQVFVTYVTT